MMWVALILRVYNYTYHRNCLIIWRVWCFTFDGLILIHLPIGFLSIWSSSTIENHGSFHSDDVIIRRINMIRRASSLPVPSSCEPLRPPSSGFTFLPRNEKEPLLRVSQTRLSWNFWNQQVSQIQSCETKQYWYVYLIGKKKILCSRFTRSVQYIYTILYWQLNYWHVYYICILKEAQNHYYLFISNTILLFLDLHLV